MIFDFSSIATVKARAILMPEAFKEPAPPPPKLTGSFLYPPLSEVPSSLVLTVGLLLPFAKALGGPFHSRNSRPIILQTFLR